MSKIILTQEEKECLEPLVDAKKTGDMAFHKASRMCRLAEKELWEKIKSMYPDAIAIAYLDNEDWIVTSCSNPKEARDTTGGYDNDSI